MAVVTATEYKGYGIVFFNGAWRICGKLRFWKFDSQKLAMDYIDAITAKQVGGGYF